MAMEAELQKPRRAVAADEPRRLCAALLARVEDAAAACSASAASSSLTRRIVVLNLAGLVALLVGFLYLNQFREGLIEARVQSLLTQGEIIAGAIAASATVETDAITIDPDKLLQLQAGESGAAQRRQSRARFLDQPGTGRAAAAPPGDADQDAGAHLRPRRLPAARFPAPLFARRRPAAATCRPSADEELSFIERTWKIVAHAVPHAPTADPRGGRARERQVAARGRSGRLTGVRASVVRVERARRDDRLGRRAGPALPRRAGRAAALDAGRRHRRHHRLGALRAPPGLRWSPPLVMIVLSLLLAGTIAGPMRRLAEAAERVRTRRQDRARRSPISPSGPTRSAISPARCAT